MNFLSKPTKILEKKGSKASFEIEELYPGYGVTVGNSLRRVLLSSLGGAAITRVKIKGASHEFSTLSGVMEDVVVILMNLKQLRFKLLGDEPQKATLKVKGEKKVRAGDLKLPSQLELLTKDAPIATLTDKQAELEMEIQVEKGFGYVPTENLKKEKEDIGMILLDAIFTPVRNVSYKVEHMRVGERTDFDRLILDVETDGTMSPEQALLQASEILMKEFDVVAQGLRDSIKEDVAVKPAKKASPVKKQKVAKTKKAAKKK